MKIEMAMQKHTLVARVKGELDLVVADRFREELEQNLDKQRARHLVLDLGGVSFIDSSGLGVILGRYKRVSEKGGQMAMIKVQPQIERILELSGITRLIKIYPSEAQALAEL
ncbi:MAG: anti-sigma F factor antagonist [Bacillota bacterium]